MLSGRIRGSPDVSDDHPAKLVDQAHARLAAPWLMHGISQQVLQVVP
jgi:hypothetical protein